MSKINALRAMREAKYEERQKALRAGTAKTRSAATPAKTAPTAPAKARAGKADAVPAADDAPVSEELCGHRNMGGRTCTREAGHAAKSHRYS